jgi:hypothetical protein
MGYGHEGEYDNHYQTDYPDAAFQKDGPAFPETPQRKANLGGPDLPLGQSNRTSWRLWGIHAGWLNHW